MISADNILNKEYKEYTNRSRYYAHDMGRDEAKAYVERLCLFFRAGWQAIFDPQFAALVDLAAQMPDAPVQDVAARLVEARGGAP